MAENTSTAGTVTDPAPATPPATPAPGTTAGSPPASAPPAPAPSPEPPITYTDFTFPKDYVVDQDVLKEFVGVAGTARLPQEQAQKVVNLAVLHAERLEQARVKAWGEQQIAWQDEAKRDGEIGGTKLEATIAAGERAMAKFGSPKLGAFIEAFGLGNHPEYLRFMARVGAALAEDNPVGGKDGGPRDLTDKEIAEKMYPQTEGMGKK